MRGEDVTEVSIWERRHRLEKMRREHMKSVMAEFDVGHQAQMLLLRHECGASEKGHAWHFTGVGPVGHAWFHCGQCGASKTEEP